MFRQPTAVSTAPIPLSSKYPFYAQRRYALYPIWSFQFLSRMLNYHSMPSSTWILQIHGDKISCKCEWNLSCSPHVLDYTFRKEIHSARDWLEQVTWLHKLTLLLNTRGMCQCPLTPNTCYILPNINRCCCNLNITCSRCESFVLKQSVAWFKCGVCLCDL